MNDPHVESLEYDITSADWISYESPAPLAFKNELGTFRTSDGCLTVEPALHFPDEDDAQAAIAPFLRAWEIHRDLRSDIEEIRFRFRRAKVVDRNPPPPGSPKILRAKAGSFAVAGSSATLRITRRAYPGPPVEFEASTEVQMAYSRWLRFRSGSEPLQAMAYFVFTLITPDGPDEASKRLCVARRILSMVSQLSSTKGSADSARKFPRDGALNDLSGEEAAWLEAAIRMLIHRMGEVGKSATLKQIGWADLPALPDRAGE